MDSNQFRIGFHTADITPDWEHYKVKLGGYLRWRKYISGVYDPLKARAICIRNVNNAAESIILISAELVGIQYRLAYLARKKISEKTGISIHHILIHAVHTHSSPDMVGIFPVTIYSDAFHLDVPWNAAVVSVKGFIEAGVKAFESANMPFKIGFGQGKAFEKPIAVQRRPPYESIYEPIRFIKFVDESDTLIALLMNYQGHPTHMPQLNTKVTGEYPSTLVQTLYKDYPTLKFASYFNGFCGDVSISSHKSFFQYIISGKSKEEAMDLAHEQLFELGKLMVATLKEGIESTRCTRLDSLKVVSKPVIAEIGRVKPWSQRKLWYKGLTEKAKAIIKDFKVKALYISLYAILRVFRTDRFPLLNIYRKKWKFYHVTEFQLFKMNDILIASAPGEPFLIYKKFLESHTKKHHLICVEMANDTMGYIFPWSFHIVGGYEKTFGIDPTFGKRLFERMAREIVKLENS